MKQNPTELPEQVIRMKWIGPQLSLSTELRHVRRADETVPKSSQKGPDGSMRKKYKTDDRVEDASDAEDTVAVSPNVPISQLSGRKTIVSQQDRLRKKVEAPSNLKRRQNEIPALRKQSRSSKAILATTNSYLLVIVSREKNSSYSQPRAGAKGNRETG